MNWRDHIWIDSERMHGTPCLRGTRVPVFVVLDNLAAGEVEGRVLVALDTYFADIRRDDPGQSSGAIVLRPRDQSIQASLSDEFVTHRARCTGQR